MPGENSILSLLHASFPKSNKENWKRAAVQEIEGKNPFSELQWHTSDGIPVMPYYDKEDTIRLDYWKNFDTSAAKNSFLGPRQWLNMPLVTLTDELTANKIALDHLSHGADGILFNVKELNTLDLNKLLHNIEWPYCSLFFQLSNKIIYEDNFRKFISEENIDPNSLTGALFWDDIPKKVDHGFYFETTKNFKPFGFTIKRSSSAKEIAEALSYGVELLETLKDEDHIFKALSSITFSLPIETNFLESIAKIKVLRMLWYQVTQAYGHKKYKPEDLHIHARSESWVAKDFQPHGNMLKSTTAAMASIVGGCDSLTLYAEDENNKVMNRIARNVSNILREESHLNKVADPIAGTYGLENIQHEIAVKAWSLFQSRMRNE